MGRSKMIRSTKRKHCDQEDEDDELFCIKETATAAAPLVDSKKKNVRNNKNKTKPFDMLSDELFGHILSFLTCLRVGYARSARNPKDLFIDSNRKAFLSQHGNIYNADAHLESQYMRLSHDEKQVWKERSKRDFMRFRQENDSYTTPQGLLSLLVKLSFVSKKWQSIVSLIMNAQAPRDIISPLDLASLKKRALSLSLAQVGKLFQKTLQQEWGDVSFPPDFVLKDQFGFEIHLSPLEFVLEHFEYHQRNDIVNVVATEYARFLVIRSVEMLACFSKEDVPTTWKQTSCSPCEIVQVFWKAHCMFPKQYARDCFSLLGPLLPADATPMDTILERNDDTSFSNYIHKCSLLFQFEQQLVQEDCVLSRFGEYWRLASTQHLLLNGSLDLLAVATECQKEQEEESDYYND